MTISRKRKNRVIRGQSMVMMVVMLSTAALGAAGLATFLIISGLRNVSSAERSMSAIFAADSGIECVLFHEFGRVSYADAVNSGFCPQYIPNSSDVNWSGNFRFVFNGRTGNVDDWSSFGNDSDKRTTRTLNIRFIRRGL